MYLSDVIVWVRTIGIIDQFPWKYMYMSKPIHNESIHTFSISVGKYKACFGLECMSDECIVVSKLKYSIYKEISFVNK